MKKTTQADKCICGHGRLVHVSRCYVKGCQCPRFIILKSKVKPKYNPSASRRQQRFMCADYGRKKAGKKTRTSMNKQQLREFCTKRVVRKKNPHLSGSLDFIGVYNKTTAQKAKRLLRISGIAGVKLTSFKDGGKSYYEIYVAKKRYDINAIRRFIKIMQEKR